MKKFVKIYIWFYMALSLIGMVMVLGKESSILEILRNTLFWALGPTCVFLYINGKKWLPINFWKIYFILMIVDIAYDFFYTRKFDTQSTGTLHVLGWLLGVLLVLPVLISVYRYAFIEKIKS